LLLHLDDIYKKFARDNINAVIDWNVDNSYLKRGKQAILILTLD
jgi:hypothetical protein